MPCEIGWITVGCAHVRRGCAGVRWSLVPARVHVSCVCAMSIVLEPELTNANPKRKNGCTVSQVTTLN